MYRLTYKKMWPRIGFYWLGAVITLVLWYGGIFFGDALLHLYAWALGLHYRGWTDSWGPLHRAPRWATRYEIRLSLVVPTALTTIDLFMVSAWRLLDRAVPKRRRRYAA